MRLCGILDHKWDKSDPYKQPCIRKGCLAERYLHYKRFPSIGEPQIDWSIIDIQNLKFK